MFPHINVLGGILATKGQALYDAIGICWMLSVFSCRSHLLHSLTATVCIHRSGVVFDVEQTLDLRRVVLDLHTVVSLQ